MTPLPSLETFAKAAELANFTATAHALSLTQAAVSQRIQALEQVIGGALFRRSGGRVFLTELGQRLLPYAQRILALHQEARDAVSGQTTPAKGELRLAASSVPGEYLLPAALDAFGQRYPHIQVRATVTDSHAVLEQVQRGKADLGLVGMREDLPHLEFAPFAHDRLQLVVSPKHAWGSRKRVSLKQLRTSPMILREAGSGSRHCLDQALAAAGLSLQDIPIALELGSNEAIKDAVARGMGTAILSRHVVDKDIRARRLHAVAVADLKLSRSMFAVHDRRRALPIPAQLFLAMLTTEFPAQPKS